jgi:hypothetical protein
MKIPVSDFARFIPGFRWPPRTPSMATRSSVRRAKRAGITWPPAASRSTYSVTARQPSRRRGRFFDQHARGDTNNGGVDAAPWSPQSPSTTSVAGHISPRASIVSQRRRRGFHVPRPGGDHHRRGLDTPLISTGTCAERQVAEWLVRAACRLARHPPAEVIIQPPFGRLRSHTDARRCSPFYGT